MATTPSDVGTDDVPDQSPLNDMLCFNLYAAARATNRLYLSLLAPWDLTFPQYLVLKLLWSREAVTVGEIAKNLMLDSGTTSPLVRRLETRGLVQRTRSTGDERVVSVALTAQGKALEEEMADLTSQVGTATGLSQVEARATIAALHALTDNLADAPVASPRARQRD